MITAAENLEGSATTHEEESSSSVDTGDKEADELLYQRFRSAFFWPAIMSGVK